MKINGNANASADANTDDNVCGGTRAQAIARFWEASRAWYDVDGAAHGWTVEDLLNRL